MDNTNQITENCNVFIDQYISCRHKEFDKAKDMNTKFTLKNCVVFYDLARICVNSHINSINE